MARQITAINQAAVQATENVSLDAVAMAQREESNEDEVKEKAPIPRAMMMVVTEL